MCSWTPAVCVSRAGGCERWLARRPSATLRGLRRTGLVAMLILSCCGASAHEIISDYARRASCPWGSLQSDRFDLFVCYVWVKARQPVDAWKTTLSNQRPQPTCKTASPNTSGTGSGANIKHMRISSTAAGVARIVLAMRCHVRSPLGRPQVQPQPCFHASLRAQV